MTLTDLSQILVGYKKRQLCLNFLFPVIDNNMNLLNKNFEKKNIEQYGSSSFEQLINLKCDNRLQKNSFTTIFINTLVKYNEDIGIDNILQKYYDNSILTIKEPIKEKFEKCLDCICQSNLILKKYIDIIYTYIRYEQYDIALFLMVSTLMLSSTIKNDFENKLNKNKTATIFENKINLYENFKKSLEIIDGFEMYKKHIDDKDFSFQEYIPIKQETLETIKNEIQSNTITLIQEETISFTSKYTNTRDDINRNYFVPLLKDNTCTELHILSRFANGWSRSEEYELLINRLEENTLIVKMLLMDINTSFANIYNDAQNHIEINPARIFENLAKKYPNNFFLRYVTVPLTNGIVHDVTNQKLRVDYLIIPPVSNKRLIHYFSKNNPNETLYYNQYSNQFDKIWNEYSKEVK